MRKIMLPPRVKAWNVSARNANATPPVPDQEISNAEFRNAIQMLDQSITNQNNRVHAQVNENCGSVASRVRDFVRINPLEFLGSQTDEDPTNFLDEIKKIFEKENRGANAASITWDSFSESFLSKFFPIELREAKSQEFMNLRQGNMTVQEYGLKFNQLSRYAHHIVVDIRAQMNKFLYGVSNLVKIDCRNNMLLGDMNIFMLMTHAQQVEGDKIREQTKENKKAKTGNYEYSQQKSGGGNRSQSQQKFSAPAPLSASVPSSKNRYDQKGRAPDSKSQGSVSGTKTYPTCPKCGKNHPDECLAGKERCFWCGQYGHRLRDCFLDRVKKVEIVTLSLKLYQHHQVAQLSRDNSSGTGGDQCQNRLYGLQDRQDQEGFPDVVTAFMELINRVFKHHLDLFVIIFIDDILIYSRNEEEHASHLRVVLPTLKDRQSFAKFSKCEFGLQSFAFLGHIISSEGIRVQSQKIEEVKQWLRPTSTTDIKSFLGLAGYYRRFVEGFSSITVPLTRLTQKIVKFQQSDESSQN
ncbi:uncharacterized protein [Solanum lycopersicum]|uniref:uncharacterized protein n=1 Tax=Solanum lycopersicum TaxID=4081 RepID=UPI0037482CFA